MLGTPGQQMQLLKMAGKNEVIARLPHSHLVASFAAIEKLEGLPTRVLAKEQKNSFCLRDLGEDLISKLQDSSATKGMRNLVVVQTLTKEQNLSERG